MGKSCEPIGGWTKMGMEAVDMERTTKEFVDKIHDTQAKDEKNRRTQGEGDPAQKLPNKQHENTPN